MAWTSRELAEGIYESPEELRSFLAGENWEFGFAPVIVLLDHIGLSAAEVWAEVHE